jgi:hypothetical protein
MFSQSPWLFVLAVIFLLPLACKEAPRGGELREEDKPVAGAVPSTSGTDLLVFRFTGFVTPSPIQGRAGKFTLTNHAEKGVREVELRLFYQDETGGVLDTFPWVVSEPGEVVTAGGTRELVAGYMVPAEAATIRVAVRRVVFSDGTARDFGEEGGP